MKPAFRPPLTAFLLLCILLSGCSSQSKIENPKSKITYTCSMHPQIRQDKPGDCPICGMKLTPLAPESTQPQTGSATVELMPAQNSMANIATEPVTERTLTRTVQLFGEIKYVQDNHLDLTSFYPGRVEQILINFNTTEIRAGQPLLELYSEEAIADQAKYLQALRDRYLTTFYERKLASAQIETIRTRLLKAGFSDDDLTQLVATKTVRKTLTVRAARSGSIIGTLPHIGERISNETILFHIVPLDPVWFAARVYEQDLSALKLGANLKLTAQAWPDKVFPGKLVFIDRTLDPQTRTLLARFVVDNPRRELLPEMSATGQLQLPSPQPVLTIPASAVIDTGTRQLVYVQTSEGHYEPRPVTLGSKPTAHHDSSPSYTEIRSGLKAGELVVTSGAFLIDAERQLRGN